jgi:uridine kinase
MLSERPFVLGVAGGTASGKTTVAKYLLEKCGAEQVAYMPHDAYYRDRLDLTLEQRMHQNYDHPDSLETSLMVEHVIQLLAGQKIDLPVYDFTNHRRTADTVTIAPSPIILIEGILIFFEPTLRALMDMMIFVDTDADVRFIRRMERDIKDRGRTLDSVIKQYLTTVRPMHNEFVEPSKRYADVIVPKGGLNQVATDMIVSRLRELLLQPR